MSMFLKGFFLSVFLCIYLYVPLRSEAASLYIDPPNTVLKRGDSVTLRVRLDTDEAERECVNAVDAVITYSPNVELVDVTIGSSIMSMWVERPVINKNERTISFAGGIPNGYCGRIDGDPRLTNVLAELIFRSPGFVINTGGEKQTDEVEVSFSDVTTVYLNDGFGTKALLSTYPAKLHLSDELGSGKRGEWQEALRADTTPPEPFAIELVDPTSASRNKYFVVFNTTDKQTGIDHYQIMEESIEKLGTFSWGRADAPWINARSPYILKDQSLNSVIRVKALDKAGNEYIATLVPEESLQTRSQGNLIVTMFLAVIVLLIVGIVVVMLRTIKRKRGKLAEEGAVEVVHDFDAVEDSKIEREDAFAEGEELEIQESNKK